MQAYRQQLQWQSAPVVNAVISEAKNGNTRATVFPSLHLWMRSMPIIRLPDYDNEITLEAVCRELPPFRSESAAACIIHLKSSADLLPVWQQVSLLILEGISGTGKTSLPYSFSRYLYNPATIVSVQPSYRDRSELLRIF